MDDLLMLLIKYKDLKNPDVQKAMKANRKSIVAFLQYVMQFGAYTS